MSFRAPPQILLIQPAANIEEDPGSHVCRKSIQRLACDSGRSHTLCPLHNFYKHLNPPDSEKPWKTGRQSRGSGDHILVIFRVLVIWWLFSIPPGEHKGLRKHQVNTQKVSGKFIRFY